MPLDRTAHTVPDGEEWATLEHIQDALNGENEARAKAVDRTTGDVQANQVTIGAESGSGDAGDRALILQVTDTEEKRFGWDESDDSLRIENEAAALLPVKVGTPTANDHAATKQYVDELPKVNVITRQSVLQGELDASNLPAALTDGGGLDLTINASAGEPLILAWAAGFDENGAVDYTAKLTDDDTLALPANSTCFVYADYNVGTGVVSFGSTTIPPYYDHFFRKPASLLRFENNLSDEFGWSGWAFTGSPTYESSSPLKGAYSFKGAGGSDGVISTNQVLMDLFQADEWTLECFWRTNSLATSQYMASGGAGFNLAWWVETTGRIWLQLSSNNSSFNIYNSFYAAGITAGTTYHMALVKEASQYKVYLNGTAVITVASSSKVYPMTALNWFSALNGLGDDACVSPYAKYKANFTPPSEISADNYHFFDKRKMMMQYGQPGNFTDKYRVFLGEVVTGASNISSIINYAYQGRYDTGTYYVSSTSTQTKNHNLGLEPGIITINEGGTHKAKDITSVGRKSLSWTGVVGLTRVQAFRGW